MNRRDLQSLARERLKDARALLKAGRYAAAYYLTGYAVECAMKACIARKVNRHDFPDKALANQCHTHDFRTLLAVAGLKGLYDNELASKSAVAANWKLLHDWSVEDRYASTITKPEAHGLYSAATARQNGVLSWLRKHW